MRISKPKIIRQQKEIIYSVDVETGNGQQKLWYSLSDQFADLLTDSSDAALSAILIPAMDQGEDIHLDGWISSMLWHNFSGAYQRLLRHVIPCLRPIQIRSAEISAIKLRGAGVATGFSAGIDSYCTLADYFYSQVPPHLKITHLLFNNVGSHGRGEKGERLFQERFSTLEPVAARMGLPFIKINSNVDSFYHRRVGFQKTHTLRNVSAALLLQGGIGRYLYSSTYPFTDIFIGESYSMAYSDPVALPLLSTESLETVSVGSEYTRIEKTLRVSDIPDSYDTLDICAGGENSGNCSVCWKCLRTLLTLDIAGRLDRYATLFDLNAYRLQKHRYIIDVLRSQSPLLKEIVHFASDRGYLFPVWPYVLGRVLCCLDRIKYIIKIPLRAIRGLFRGLLAILRRKDSCSCPPH